MEPNQVQLFESRITLLSRLGEVGSIEDQRFERRTQERRVSMRNGLVARREEISLLHANRSTNPPTKTYLLAIWILQLSDRERD